MSDEYRFPIDPLTEHLTERLALRQREASIRNLSQLLGITSSTFCRLRKHGLSVGQADHYAKVVQRHPASIWTDWYQVPIDESKLMMPKERAVAKRAARRATVAA